MTEKFVVGLIVSNHFGVLNRVAGLYSKRGYNIDSLAVGRTEDPELSRMTITSTGDSYMKDQVMKQLNKLYDVKKVALLDYHAAVSVEHLLIKLKTNGKSNCKLIALITSFGGKVVDLGDGYVVADVTGSNEQINDFIDQCIPYGIMEVCRSGLISLSKGTDNLLSTHNEK